MPASHYAELEVWQLAMELAEDIYRLSRTFPPDERFGMTSQLQRAGVSVPSNIAEGNARDTTKDYARFVSLARGSLAEVETQLLLAERVGLGDKESAEGCQAKAKRVGSMLVRLHAALRSRLHPESPVPSPESR